MVLSNNKSFNLIRNPSQSLKIPITQQVEQKEEKMHLKSNGIFSQSFLVIDKIMVEGRLLWDLAPEHLGESFDGLPYEV